VNTTSRFFVAYETNETKRREIFAHPLSTNPLALPLATCTSRRTPAYQVIEQSSSPLAVAVTHQTLALNQVDWPRCCFGTRSKEIRFCILASYAGSAFSRLFVNSEAKEMSEEGYLDRSKCGQRLLLVLARPWEGVSWCEGDIPLRYC